jgi:hypothetical protein
LHRLRSQGRGCVDEGTACGDGCAEDMIGAQTDWGGIGERERGFGEEGGDASAEHRGGEEGAVDGLVHNRWA